MTVNTEQYHALIHKNDELADRLGRTRRINEEVLTLLRNAHIALTERTPPKLHVVSDHLERVIETLSRESNHEN